MTRPLPDPARTRALVLQARDHLARLVGPEGSFTYAHPLNRPSTRLPGYNELRHCGSLWFMLRATLELDQAPALPAETADALTRAAGHVMARMAEPDWLPAGQIVLVAEGAVKLGGIGLALCMLAEFASFLRSAGLGGPAEAAALAQVTTGLQDYALAQIDGADFHHKRALDSGALLPFRSDYYTGEAILGLLLTGCTAPDLARVTRALMARRYGWNEQSHWMAYAGCEALERGLVPEAQGRDYLAGLAATILLNPGYRARRASTPIACRAEALSRILLLSDRRPGLFAPEMLAAFRAHLHQDLALQLHWHRRGQFHKGDGDDRVQIDYIQHNATAFLNWHLHTAAAVQHGN